MKNNVKLMDFTLFGTSSGSQPAFGCQPAFRSQLQLVKTQVSVPFFSIFSIFPQLEVKCFKTAKKDKSDQLLGVQKPES